MKRPLLLPLVPLYAAGLALRELRLQRGWEKVRRLRHPVISIGNLATGGSGKTPLTIALAKLLSTRGFHVDVLSRGYGRRSTAPLRVDPNGSADEFGDEPLLIAREANIPVYVASDRFDAGPLAEASLHDLSAASGPSPNAAQEKQEASGHDFSRAESPEEVGALAPAPSIHILDDGFQHRQLARDIDILLIDRDDWHDSLLPAGNLREPVHAIRRAHVLAVPANDAALESELRAWGWTGPIWRIHRRMQVPHIDGPVLAFCGIARPHQFFAGLEGSGIRIADRIVFPDHHRYTPADIERLDSAAQRTGTTAILTTAKDHVRMGNLLTRAPLHPVQLSTEILDESAALEWLVARIGIPLANAAL